ncbi:hypothetical protein [Streptomyces sp. NPDC058373]|uniref:hypothetical protein n=1 Tax=Streptomyces sp. NPDC058373 TaxID=3346465 RepID=UPI0036479040
MTDIATDTGSDSGTETAPVVASEGGAEPNFYLDLADARIVATEALLEAASAQTAAHRGGRGRGQVSASRSGR